MQEDKRASRQSQVFQEFKKRTARAHSVMDEKWVKVSHSGFLCDINRLKLSFGPHAKLLLLSSFFPPDIVNHIHKNNHDSLSKSICKLFEFLFFRMFCRRNSFHVERLIFIELSMIMIIDLAYMIFCHLLKLWFVRVFEYNAVVLFTEILRLLISFKHTNFIQKF